MAPDQPAAIADDAALLEAARGGDESAFGRLVDPHRGALHAHCYRMLGSVHDAEDALQEAMLRAWKGLEKFEGRSAVKSWLYKIATNTCLDAISRRPKRVLPMDHNAASDPEEGPGAPIMENIWLEPYADEALDVAEETAGPEASYEQREAVELAFIAALQHLPANQRAVLITREVLGYSAKEVAELLDTSVASVNSALQRARKAVEERSPEQSQQETIRSLGDEKVRALVEGYVEDWQRGDVDAVVARLSEDASFAMPPMSRWFSGRDAIREWMASSPLSGEFRWKPLSTMANGQPALAFYSWDEDSNSFLPFALNVLSFRGDEISNVTAFIVRDLSDPDDAVQARAPDEPFDANALDAAFARFGMPERLDG